MISLEIESNGVDLSNIDENWISSISEHILIDHDHKEAKKSKPKKTTPTKKIPVKKAKPAVKKSKSIKKVSKK